MNLSLKGSTEDLYRFIDSLHKKVIVTSVTGLRIGNVSGEVPSAQVSLIFFLEPELTETKEGSK